jgi:hypothetical protein
LVRSSSKFTTFQITVLDEPLHIGCTWHVACSPLTHRPTTNGTPQAKRPKNIGNTKNNIWRLFVEGPIEKTEKNIAKIRKIIKTKNIGKIKKTFEIQKTLANTKNIKKNTFSRSPGDGGG